MLRVDLKLGFACNNRCAFCVQGDKRDRYEPRGMEQIEADLRQGRERGFSSLVVTGGEPTVQPLFLDVIRLARRLGYSAIQVQTNGRLFCYDKVCRAAVAAGATEFSPALHASTPKIHDRLTRAELSHEQTVEAIENLVKLGQVVVTNSVITSLNYQDLPDLARLLVALGVNQFQLAFVHIVGTAATNRDWLVPRKRDVMPYVLEALDVGREANVRCMTEAIPYCMMPGYEEHVAEQIIPETMIYDADKTIEDYGAYRRGEGKAKGPDCRLCAWERSCEGPWREYPEMYGWEEMRPITGEPAVPAAR